MATAQLVRSQTESRQFPAISPQLYASDHPLLRLVDASLTRAQRYTEQPLTGSAALTRLLVLHREAMQTEDTGRWQAATYLWQRVLDEARLLYPENWDEFGGETVRNAFYAEVLCDTHLAYHNGYTEFQTTKTRAPFHETRAEDYLTLLGVPKTDIAAMKRTGFDRQITQGWGAQDWQKVLDNCNSVLALSPYEEKYRELAARAGFNLVTTKLGKGSNAYEAANDLRLIEQGLRAVESISAMQPYNSLWFDYLALLTHLQAIRQFNTGQMAQALATERKALTYEPELIVAEQSLANMRVELGKIGQQLQAARATMRPGMTLSIQGQMLATQVSTGNALEERFRTSPEATRIVRSVQVARGATIWRRISLPDPEKERDETWIDLAAQLNAFAKQRTPIAMIPVLWSGVVAKNPRLSPITADMLMTYAQTYMSPTQQPPQDPIWLPVVTSNATAPRITVTGQMQQGSPTRGDTPFYYWWYSAQSRSIKRLLALAAVLIVFGFGAVIYGQSVQANRQAQTVALREARQTAYDQLIAAVNAGDHLGVLDAAEAFYASPPASGDDNRQAQVDRLYNEALVAWVLQTNPSQDEIDARVSRYQSLRGHA